MEIHITPNGGAAIFLSEEEADELLNNPDHAKKLALRLLKGRNPGTGQVEIDYFNRGGRHMMLIRPRCDEQFAGGRIFNDFEELYEATRVLNDDEPSELYFCDGRYWLFCGRGEGLRRLEEFGREADVRQYPYVREHGKLLIGTRVVECLRGYFEKAVKGNACR